MHLVSKLFLSIDARPLRRLVVCLGAVLMLLTAACGTPTTTGAPDEDGADALAGADIDLNDVDLSDIDVAALDIAGLDIAGLDISLDGIDIAWDSTGNPDVPQDAAADVTGTVDIGELDTPQLDAPTGDGGEDAAAGDDAAAPDTGAADTTESDTSGSDTSGSDTAAPDAGIVDVPVDGFVGCTSTEGCDDGNPCTTDTCGTDGLCTYVDNGAGCSDGNLCTISDTCAQGVCVPGDVSPCDDGNPCTDDSCNPGIGACSFLNNLVACNDGLTCTYGDSCADGACTGTLGDAACEDGNTCTADSCDQMNDVCIHTPIDAQCSDGNVCTGGDGCVNGVCETPEFGTPALDQGSYTGGGVTNINPYGQWGDTGFGQFFTAGQSGALESVELGVTMTQPSSFGYQKSVAAGTVYMNVWDGVSGKLLGSSAVDTAKLSDGTKAMSAGEVNGTVFPFSGVYLKAGNSYRFGISVAVTYKPTCQNSSNYQYCSGTFVNAITFQACTTSSDCVWPISLGASSDETAYAGGDSYTESLTFPGPQMKKSDLQFKTVVKAAFNEALDGTTCDDGLACTIQDACVLGKCVAQLDCDDKIACTVDACTPTGCTYTPDAKACSDGDACTLEACDLAVGCTGTGAAPDDTDCNDGNFCVAAATCKSGKCEETLKTCPDQDFCVVGLCDKAANGCTVVLRKCPTVGVCMATSCDSVAGACVSTFVGPGQPCDDGDPCTLFSTCGADQTCTTTFAGICTTGTPCTTNLQCASHNCMGGTCAEFSCPNGTQDAGEFGVDCGGICPIGCGAGTYCAADKDCATGLVCANSYCATP